MGFSLTLPCNSMPCSGCVWKRQKSAQTVAYTKHFDKSCVRMIQPRCHSFRRVAPSRGLHTSFAPVPGGMRHVDIEQCGADCGNMFQGLLAAAKGHGNGGRQGCNDSKREQHPVERRTFEIWLVFLVWFNSKRVIRKANG